MREMRPAPHSGWRERKAKARLIDDGEDSVSHSVWERRGVFVISSLKFAEAPDPSKDLILQWHVSASIFRDRASARLDDETAKQMLACFGLSKAEEDNHHPGVARQWWMPVDPKRRVDCECKETETVIVEPDGYRWSTPTGPLECSGCELEAAIEGDSELAAAGAQRPCPIHNPGEMRP